MQAHTANQLTAKKCTSCEGGTPKYTRAQAEEQLQQLAGWKLTADAQRIGREWNAKDFMAAIAFFNSVAKLAESENHHPDLHLENYRRVRIEIWTHAIGGLSENDFILAAKIDLLPIELKKSS